MVPQGEHNGVFEEGKCKGFSSLSVVLRTQEERKGFINLTLIKLEQLIYSAKMCSSCCLKQPG